MNKSTINQSNLENSYSSTPEESCCSQSSCCAPQSPIMHTAPKVGRNDLCPCDSGRKFKKCCG